MAAALGKDEVGGGAHFGELTGLDGAPSWLRQMLGTTRVVLLLCFFFFFFYHTGATRASGTRRNQRGKGEYGDIPCPAAWANFPNTSLSSPSSSLRLPNASGSQLTPSRDP